MKEKRTLKRLLSMFLSFVMVVSMITVTDFTHQSNGVSDVKAAVTPADHTTLGGGNPLPYEATNLITDGNFTSNVNFTIKGNGSLVNNMAYINITGTDDYLARWSIQCEANTTYRISYYINVMEASSLKYNMFIWCTTEGSGGWKDYAMPTTITSNTDGWQKVDFSWKCTNAGTYALGFKNYNESGSAQVYIDDVVMYKANPEYLKLDWQEVTDAANWKFKASRVKTNDQYYRFSKITIDGKEYNDGAWLGFDMNTEDVAYIYTGGFEGKGADPVSSIYIAKGTVMTGRTSPWGAENATGNDFILENDIIVEKVNGTWKSVEWHPQDHTSLLDGGNAIPDGATNLISGGDLTSKPSTMDLVGNAKVENGYVHLDVTGEDDYTQIYGITVTAGHEYTISYYIYIKDAKNLSYNMYWSTPWADNIMTESLTADTNGWQKVEFKYTATKTGTTSIGFKNYAGSGTAQIYIDDIAVYEEPTILEDHTSQGGNTVPEGKVNLISNGDLTSKPEKMDLVGNAKVTNGYVHLDVTGDDDRTQIWGIPVTEGHEYIISYYIYIKDAQNLIYNMYWSSSWADYIMSDSLTADTNGWQKVEFKYTAKKTETTTIGFKNYAGSGTAQIYIDDIVMYDSTVEKIKTSVDLTYDATLDTQIQFTIPNDKIQTLKDTSGWPSEAGKATINGKQVDVAFCVGPYNAGSDKRYVYLQGQEVINAMATGLLKLEGSVVVTYGNEEITYNFKETTYIEKLGNVWGKYTSVHEYPNGNDTYYNIDNGTTYLVTSSNDAVEVKKNGTLINATAGTTLNEVGVYDITNIENDEKFVKKVYLYKNGDANASGNVDIYDLVAMKCASEGKECAMPYAADLNRSGTVDSTDLRAMRRALAMGNADTAFIQVKGNSVLNGVMPIGGMAGPSYDSENPTKFVNDEVWSALEEVGINHIGYDSNDFSNKNFGTIPYDNMKLAEKHNIGIYVLDHHVDTAGKSENNGYLPLLGTNKDGIVNRLGLYSSYKSFLGMHVVDEPATSDYMTDGERKLDKYSTGISLFKDYANINGYVNAYPYDYDMKVNTTNSNKYRNYLQAISDAGSEILSYDFYPTRVKETTYYNVVDKEYQHSSFSKNSISYDKFYTNLVIAREKAEANNKPFWAYAQTGVVDKNYYATVDDKYLPTVSEMQWEINAALAFGAKGIQYYQIMQSKDYAKNVTESNGYDYTRAGLISWNGQKNTKYFDGAKSINQYIAKIDEVLMNSENKGVIAKDSNASKYVSTAGLSSYKEVTSVTCANALVGCFDYYGKTALLVTNCNVSSAQNITLNFGKNCTGTVTKHDCTTEDVSGESKTLNIGAGQSALVVLD